MKIGIVTEYYYPLIGGITEHVHHFSVEAKKLGHTPVIITGNAGEDHDVDIKGLRIVKIGRSVPIYSNGSIARMAFGFNIGRRLKKLFASEKFDVIHIHSPFVPTLPLLAQKHTNTLTIGTFHTQFDSSSGLKIWQGMLQKYFDALHGKIAVSQLCIDSIGKYFNGDMRIIPNGVDVDKFTPAAEKLEEFSDGMFNILFLSRLEPRNGLEYLIKAFKLLREKRRDIRLIVAGDGPLRKFYESMIPENLEPFVKFVGRVNGVRPNYFASADVFCFTTTKASFGITLLEGMAAGKPVVAFSMPAFEMILKNGEEGVLCGEPDPAGLADAINSLLNDAGLRRQIGENARRRALDFSWHKVTKQILEYYEEIASHY